MYLSQYKGPETLQVYVYCSNSNLVEEAKEKAKDYGYYFYSRDNSGGGDGAVFDFVELCKREKKIFSKVIYFEETCEPMCDKWMEYLIAKVESGYSVYGWNWNWRGRRRHNSKTLIFGQGIRKCFAYELEAKSHPLGIDLKSNIIDVPHFSSECLIIDFKLLLDFPLSNPRSDPWISVAPKEYGLSMERFFWEQGASIQDTNVVNFQFAFLKLKGKWPSYMNLDRWRFRELNFKSGDYDRYVAKGINLRRLSIKHLMIHAIYVVRNMAKFIIISKFGFQPISKLQEFL
jgi:hypothetical protein